jgi:cell division protein FtsI (penicillin-binding protein 3)
VVAAPIFQKIAAAALRQYGVPSSIDAPEPVLAGRWEDSGQHIASGPAGPGASLVTIAPASTSTTYPDLTGLSARDAVNMLARLGYPVQLRGAGLVIAQWPEPGTAVDPGTTVVLALDRREPDSVTRAAP